MTPRKPSRAKWRGLTDAEYEAMRDAQGNRCAICGKPPKTKRLEADHDHKTLKARELLCWTCNRFILGKYATAEKLRAAADYLDKHAAA